MDERGTKHYLLKHQRELNVNINLLHKINLKPVRFNVKTVSE